jgi:rSAM/selenodomain-associated transferase 1
MTRIVIFAKQPVPGKVKTRLIPALGEDGAARLAAKMLDRTIEEALATGLQVELCGDPDPAGWYRGPAAVSAQGEGDLGARLARAARHPPVLLIGSDCPELDRDRLTAAAEALAAHDAILHPATDGGYVLLGLARFDPSIFADIPWSSSAVCAETLARLDALGWRVEVRGTLSDVDEPADLALVGLG